MAKILVKFLDDLSPSELKLRDLPRKPDGLYNLAFNEYGQEVKRAGYEKYNIDVIGEGAHKITGMHRFYKQYVLLMTDKEFICAWNTSLYKLPDAGEHTPAALTGCPVLSEDADTYFATFANHCYIVNGEDTMMKYNITNVRLVGIDPPDDPPDGTSSADAEGHLSEGDYKVCYTYVDEDGYEGNASDSVKISASDNDKIALTDMVVSSDAKVTKHRIYRTIADGDIFYFDKEIDEATSADLTQSDNDLALKSTLHTDHNAPPDAPSLISKRRSRINIAVDDKLWISKNYDKTTGVRSVEYFPPTNYYPTGNGQKITGLKEQLITLPVFTEDSIERFIGTNNTNFELRNSFALESCIAKRSLVNCENYLVYLGFNGIFYFDGNTTGEFSSRLNEYIKANINYDYAHLSCATYFDNKYLICIPTTTNLPDVTIYYDFKTKTCGIYSFAFSCFSKWDKGGDGLLLKGGSNTIGRVYSVLSGLDDDNSDITAYDDIEPLDFGKSEVYKQFYSVFVKIKTTTGISFRLYYTIDDGSETYVSKTLTANKTKWYRICLGEGGKCGRAIKPRLYMSDKLYFEIHGMAICYDEEPFSEERE